MIERMKKGGRWCRPCVKKLKVALSALKRPGLDALALRKGQGEAIVVCGDGERRVPLEFAPSRPQEEVRKVVEGWGEAVLSQIVEVSLDRSGKANGLVNQLLPHAAVVAARLQGMKIVNQALAVARKT